MLTYVNRRDVGFSDGDDGHGSAGFPRFDPTYFKSAEANPTQPNATRPAAGDTPLFQQWNQQWK